MRNSFFTLICLLLLTSCSYKIYVVRHAEKAATPQNNPTLSPNGTQRALALRQELQHKKIRKIYSTNTTRTLSTAEPLALVVDIKPSIYPARPDSSFIRTLKSNATNQLVVGHSNTIDDIANMLAGETVVPGDLPETVFDNLYILKFRKSGKGKPRFINKKYGSAKTSDQGTMK
jgi:broad specificity phosphatase PhoE